MRLTSALLRHWRADPSVRDYAETVPGAGGAGVAFLAAAAISFGLMRVVLVVSHRVSVARFTGLCAGGLVMTYITFEAALRDEHKSGPDAGFGRPWRDVDGPRIYFTAPPLGMLSPPRCFAGSRGCPLSSAPSSTT